MINSFHIFSRFSGLIANLSQCEIAGIGLLKGVKVVFCGIKSIDLASDTIKYQEHNFVIAKSQKRKGIFVRS